MFDIESPDQNNDFLRQVNLLYESEVERLGVATMSVDLFFACYLRYMSRFGYFRFGPVSIDVSLIEGIVGQTAQRRSKGDWRPPSVGDDLVRWSRILMDEVRRSGRPRIDELHYLLAFMRFGEGLPERVFSELGVTPEQVEDHARHQDAPTARLERLYSPEEVAEYLNVHVQTVRAWIRSGRLKARRLAGQRALRIQEPDIQSLLDPLEGNDPDLAER